MINVYNFVSQIDFIFVGIEKLKNCYKNIKKEYCGENNEMWLEKCSTAFKNQGYNKVQDIDKLNPEDFH
jgi:hypothetical protein